MIDELSSEWKDALAGCHYLKDSQMITISSKEENDFASDLAKVEFQYLFNSTHFAFMKTNKVSP